jgi:hypothetical protein
MLIDVYLNQNTHDVSKLIKLIRSKGVQAEEGIKI